MLALVRSREWEGVVPICAVCRHLEMADSQPTNLIGLITGVECIVDSAQARLDDGPVGGQHVMAHVCPEHVVAIYRGRVPGVAMAWQAAATV